MDKDRPGTVRRPLNFFASIGRIDGPVFEAGHQSNPQYSSFSTSQVMLPGQNQQSAGSSQPAYIGDVPAEHHFSSNAAPPIVPRHIDQQRVPSFIGFEHSPKVSGNSNPPSRTKEPYTVRKPAARSLTRPKNASAFSRPAAPRASRSVSGEPSTAKRARGRSPKEVVAAQSQPLGMKTVKSRTPFHFSGIMLATSPHLPKDLPWPVRVLSGPEVDALEVMSPGKKEELERYWNSPEKDIVIVRYIFPPPVKGKFKFDGLFSLESARVDDLSQFPRNIQAHLEASRMCIPQLKDRCDPKATRTPLEEYFVPAIKLGKALLEFVDAGDPDRPEMSKRPPDRAFAEGLFVFPPQKIFEEPWWNDLRENLLTEKWGITELRRVLPPGGGSKVNQAKARSDFGQFARRMPSDTLPAAPAPKIFAAAPSVKQKLPLPRDSRQPVDSRPLSAEPLPHVLRELVDERPGPRPLRVTTEALVRQHRAQNTKVLPGGIGTSFFSATFGVGGNGDVSSSTSESDSEVEHALVVATTGPTPRFAPAGSAAKTVEISSLSYVDECGNDEVNDQSCGENKDSDAAADLGPREILAHSDYSSDTNSSSSPSRGPPRTMEPSEIGMGFFSLESTKEPITTGAAHKTYNDKGTLVYSDYSSDSSDTGSQESSPLPPVAPQTQDLDAVEEGLPAEDLPGDQSCGPKDSHSTADLCAALSAAQLALESNSAPIQTILGNLGRSIAGACDLSKFMTKPTESALLRAETAAEQVARASSTRIISRRAPSELTGAPLEQTAADPSPQNISNGCQSPLSPPHRGERAPWLRQLVRSDGFIFTERCSIEL